MMICHHSTDLLVSSARSRSVRRRSRSKSVTESGKDICKPAVTSPVGSSRRNGEVDVIVTTVDSHHVVPAASSMPRLQLGQVEVDTLGPPQRAPPKPPMMLPRLSVVPQALPSATALNVEPTRAAFTTEGGLSKHLLMNSSAVRLALKVRCSNNHYFRVNPVFSFVDSGTMKELEIIRLQGGEPRKDLVQLVYVVCRDIDTDARQLFGPRAKFRSVKLLISTI